MRKLVGSLSRRTALWRSPADPRQATRDSLYKGDVPTAALAHSTRELERLRSQLDNSLLTEIAEGRLE